MVSCHVNLWREKHQKMYIRIAEIFFDSIFIIKKIKKKNFAKMLSKVSINKHCIKLLNTANKQENLRRIIPISLSSHSTKTT